MGAGWAWARRELRRRWGANVALVVLIAVAGGVVLTAAAGARRTETAFARFLERSAAADVQLQYASEDNVDAEVLAALQAHPDVEAAAPLFFVVSFSADSEYELGIFAGPDDDLFRAVDRPRVLEGRRPEPTAVDEVLLNRVTQRDLGVEVGDTLRLGTFSAEQFGDEDFTEPAGPVLELRVVGIGVTPYDIADDDFVGMFATPAFHAAHWGEVGGFGPSFQVATRPGRDPVAVVQEAIAGFELQEVDLTPTAELSAKVDDGTRVLGTGLWAFTLVAGLSALVACGQALHRRVADVGRDQPTLRAMGVAGRGRRAAVAMAITPVVLAGSVLALLLAIPASATMPVGLARVAEPDPGIAVDPAILAAGALLLATVLLLVVAASTWRVSRAGPEAGAAPAAVRSRRSLARAAGARLSPPANLGVGMALEPGAGSTAVPVRSALVGAAVGAAGVVAVLTFGASLDALVDTPARSGWNWTLAPDIASEEELATLLDVPGTVDVGRLLQRQVIIDGEQVLGVAVQAEEGAPSLTVLRGRMPAGPREVALAPELAERTGAGPGDAVELTAADGRTREMVVVGEVLLPTFDDNAFNDGLAVAPGAIEDLAHSDGFDSTIVSFEDGVPTAEAAARISEVLPDALSVYAYPSLPPDVANLAEVRFLPKLLGGFLAALALAAVGHALATSVRRRRRDLGIARALGFRSADLLRTVTSQSATLVAVGLLVGVPAGVVLGRVSWRVVAEGTGVAATPTVPGAALVLLSVGALAASAALASLPGRAAARQHPVDALRSE